MAERAAHELHPRTGLERFAPEPGAAPREGRSGACTSSPARRHEGAWQCARPMTKGAAHDKLREIVKSNPTEIDHGRCSRSMKRGRMSEPLAQYGFLSWLRRGVSHAHRAARWGRRAAAARNDHGAPRLQCRCEVGRRAAAAARQRRAGQLRPPLGCAHLAARRSRGCREQLLPADRIPRARSALARDARQRSRHPDDCIPWIVLIVLRDEEADSPLGHAAVVPFRRCREGHRVAA